MSDEEWENLGRHPDPVFDTVESLGEVLSLGFFEQDDTAGVYTIRHRETGETREVTVNAGQSLGEAIANGQFTDR